MKEIITALISKVKSFIKEYKEKKAITGYLKVINPRMIKNVIYDYNGDPLHFLLLSEFNIERPYDKWKHFSIKPYEWTLFNDEFIKNVITNAKSAYKYILDTEVINYFHKAYWKIEICDNGEIILNRNIRIDMLANNRYNDKDDRIVLFIDNKDNGFGSFLYWLKLVSNLKYNKTPDDNSNTHKENNIPKRRKRNIRRSRSIFKKNLEPACVVEETATNQNTNDDIVKKNILNDIGVDLATEEIELSSDNIKFNIKLNKLQLATQDINKEECNSGYYIIRKVLGSFYTISGLNSLLSLDEEDGEYILCTEDQLNENILPPTYFFVPVAA